MPDWLAVTDTSLPAVGVLLLRLGLASVLGFVAALIHSRTLGRRPLPTALPATLVMLCVLVAFVTLVIGDSVARAFGLVGALSIVRFRSIVEDTRDTAFVIFAVGLGMAAGSGAGALAVVGVPVVAVVAWLTALRDSYRASVHAELKLKLALSHDKAAVAAALAKHFGRVTPTGAGTTKQGGGLEFTYAVSLADAAGLAAAATELNLIEGVQGVELKAD